MAKKARAAKRAAAPKAKRTSKTKPTPGSYLQTISKSQPCYIGLDKIIALVNSGGPVGRVFINVPTVQPGAINAIDTNETPTALLAKLGGMTVDWVQVSLNGVAFVKKVAIVAVCPFGATPSNGSTIALVDGSHLNVADDTKSLFTRLVS